MSREEKHIWKAWRRMKYNINPESGIPIYRQLADIIFAEIKSGSIKSGSKLPTVRELAEEAGVARGTVKRAYEELRRDGAVEMTQGRGTFAKYAPESGKSRKDRAMEAIDKMLDTLRELELSPSEAQIFVELRLREYARRGDRARVALVECTPEILGQIAESLREIGGAEVRSFLLSDVLSYPYKLSDDADIILTTQNHAAELEKALPEEKKLMRAALALRPESGAAAERRRGDSLQKSPLRSLDGGGAEELFQSGKHGAALCARRRAFGVPPGQNRRAAAGKLRKFLLAEGGKGAFRLR